MTENKQQVLKKTVYTYFFNEVKFGLKWQDLGQGKTLRKVLSYKLVIISIITFKDNVKESKLNYLSLMIT